MRIADERPHNKTTSLSCNHPRPPQFTSQGQVALTARLVDVEGGVAEIVFCVADTGIGIKPDKLDLIFDTFAQADGSTTRVSCRNLHPMFLVAS